MPSIPRYDERQVDLNLLPGQRQQIAAPAAAFGGQYAEDLGKVGKVLGGVADAATEFAIKEKRKVDEAAVNDVLDTASKELNAEREKFTSDRSKYVGPDREKQAPLAEEYSLRAGEILDKHALKISDPYQQELLLTKGRDLLQREMDFGYELETKANNEYLINTGTKVVDSALRMAMDSGGEPSLLTPAMDSVASGVRNIGAGNQWDDATIEQKTAEAQGKVAAMLIGKLMDDQQFGKANQLFGEFKGKIPVELHEKLKSGLEEGDLEAEARLAVGDAISKGLSYKEFFDSVKGEGKSQDKIRAYGKQRYAEIAHAKKVDQQAANEEGLGFVLKGKPIPTATRNRMSVDAQLSLKDYYEKRARGDKIKTDLPTYEMVRAKVLEDETFDLTPYVNVLSEGDYKGLVKLKQDSSSKAKLAYIKKVDAEIKRLSADLPEQLRPLYSKWARDNLIAASDEDRPLSDEEMNKILWRGLTQRKGPGFFGSTKFVFQGAEGDYVVRPGDGTESIRSRYDAETPAGQATQDSWNEYVERTYTVVPQSERTRITASLRKFGIVPTEEKILEFYLNGQAEKKQ